MATYRARAARLVLATGCLVAGINLASGHDVAAAMTMPAVRFHRLMPADTQVSDGYLELLSTRLRHIPPIIVRPAHSHRTALRPFIPNCRW
jgi:hypothetical protein